MKSHDTQSSLSLWFFLQNNVRKLSTPHPSLLPLQRPLVVMVVLWVSAAIVVLEISRTNPQLTCSCFHCCLTYMDFFLVFTDEIRCMYAHVVKD